MNRKVVSGLIVLSICFSSALSYEGQHGFKEVQNEFTDSPRSSMTMVDVIQRMYTECLNEGSFSCVKPKILSFLSTSVKNGNIQITRDLSISPKDEEAVPEVNSKHDNGFYEGVQTADMILLKKLDGFLSTHELKMVVPEQIRFIPGFSKNIPEEVRVPLADPSNDDIEEGRSKGLMKKVILPFLLALKFKVSALIPLAITLIALKAWKALTLGILSIVLSIVLILFKIAKPKEMNYEIVHYPVVEHYHGHGRSLDADSLAYRSYRRKDH